jgi:hypothetical protein
MDHKTQRDRIALEPGWTDHGPDWLLVGKQAIPLGSARDRAEARCCGDYAPGTCETCPLIVKAAEATSRPRPASPRPVRFGVGIAAGFVGARLTTNSAERKATPITSGVLDYFPLAMAAVARLSKRGNDKHNPGEPLHWAREKSTDHADCIARHLIERGTIEPESGEALEACLAWRALALLQLAEEKRLAVKPVGV